MRVEIPKPNHLHMVKLGQPMLVTNDGEVDGVVNVIGSTQYTIRTTGSRFEKIGGMAVGPKGRRIAVPATTEMVATYEREVAEWRAKIMCDLECAMIRTNKTDDPYRRVAALLGDELLRAIEAKLGKDGK